MRLRQHFCTLALSSWASAGEGKTGISTQEIGSRNILRVLWRFICTETWKG